MQILIVFLMNKLKQNNNNSNINKKMSFEVQNIKNGFFNSEVLDLSTFEMIALLFNIV